MEIKEVKIPVPWGHIAVKTWGNERDPIILVIHGWVDNAGSFDTLIPLLPTSYYYYCMDLPSHGRSSHLESSLFVHNSDYVLILKYVHDYLNRGKLIIMGHSLGAALATNFAQMYPECVSKLVCFDCLHYFAQSAQIVYESQKKSIDIRVRFMKKNKLEAPVYTKDEALQRMMQSRMTPLSRKAAEILAERGLEKVDDEKYRFTLAVNSRNSLFTKYTANELADLAQSFPVTCPHLVVFSTNSSYSLLGYKKLLEVYRQNKNYELHIVKGSHECHLENPEDVAPIVTNFLNKQHSKL
ncbi:uncharacterized protein CBL_10440 [Carabus blaptoides fortunei]